MAQETETVAALPAVAIAVEPPPTTLESPSPKRRNRKKNRRGSTASADEDEAEDEQEAAAAVSPCVSLLGDVATADLVSLPSPVAAVSSSSDVFAEPPLNVEKAMEQLTLTPVEAPAPKEDGLLKLPMHPSSGRLPLTPPPTPEPFVVHSPEKEQSRVAPMASDVQLLSTVVETPPTIAPVQAEETTMNPMETADVVGRIEVETALVMEAPAPVIEVTVEPEPARNAAVEQVTTELSSTLADMSLGNKISTSNELATPDAVVEEVAEMEAASAEVVPPVRESPVETVVSVPSPVQEVQVDPVADDHVDLTPSPTGNADANSISATPAEAPSAETLVPEQAATDLPAILPIEVTPALAPVPNESGGAATPPPNEEVSPQPLRRNKRKGDSPEQKPHSAPVAVPKAFPKAQQNKTVASSIVAAKSKHVVPKELSEPHPQSRPAKRKGDVADTKPPPAPITEPAKEIRPKRLVARSSSGSALNKAKTDPDGKPSATVAARPVHDSKKESMMNPTASSLARATAAEARKALLKSGVAKKQPTRKSMRAKTTAKPHTPATSIPTDKPVSAPPAPGGTDDGDDSQRNVKRRLNTTEVEAASKRLYEDAKEAKLRKDARRAELQETYTFAPQVNNFKRRTNPGEADDPNQDHFTRLHAQAKELLEKKRELQHQHERDGCTFAPSISARAKRLTRTNSGPRYENLYKHAQELKQKREEKLLEKAKTAEEQCPFKPKITASKSPVKTKPLYDSERERQKRLALEQKKIEAEMTECTFKPKVSAKRMKSKAEEPASATNDAAVDANPYKRLYQASIDRTERLQKLRQERDEEEKAQAPFQPKITARSRALKAKAQAKEPFHKRLYNKDYMKKLDAEREQRRLEEEQQFTFKPEINEPPEEIKTKVNERASPRKSIFERLYDEKDKMKEKIEMGEELRLQKEMAECTFQPQIKVDANGEPAPPVWERLTSYDKAQVIEEREKLKEQLEMQECTFKPEVKSPDALSMKRSPSFNVYDRLTGSGSNSPLDPTRSNFITRRPSSSPGRQSPDTKGVSIGRIIKLTKFSLPTERKMPSRTYSISQPSSVNKPAMKRSTSFSAPKSAASSPTMSTADILSNLAGRSQHGEASTATSGDATLPQTITENYESWSAALDAKLRHL
ncbi:hypothetical protein PR003_g2253 [Phytophthora rubi]|uniref:Uncharacterized protein n=1 Tax=Phytophthora rubi TaxID=129364 RepID=A0A6A3NY44_9STRA|nr:hypothetical protein PR002_g2360 [Phytophthora rubi]KAE9050592.1 hypothetical protein PR001_g2257 [Phytophthora rubi]KAE9356572.1 hypothetical protein PR003_g2253 [Phytophthora rubi]